MFKIRKTLQHYLIPLQHYLNPLHVYCRLVDRGVDRERAIIKCKKYERWIYKPISKLLSVKINKM